VHRAARARLRGVAVGARHAHVVDTAPRVPVTAAGRRALVALLDVADAPPHRHAHVQADVDGCVQTTGDRAGRTSYHVPQVMAAAHNDSGSAPDMHRICCGCHSSRITTGGTRHRAAQRRCASRMTTSYAACRSGHGAFVGEDTVESRRLHRVAGPPVRVHVAARHDRARAAPARHRVSVDRSTEVEKTNKNQKIGTATVKRVLIHSHRLISMHPFSGGAYRT
jgi:hypothetical protein